MIEQASITLTDQAVVKLQALIAEENNPNIGLRVFVSGGGCSGLQYGMALDDEIRPEDSVIETAGVRVIVDEFSAGHIKGSEIDYVDGLMGAGFTVHNPNAVHSCSCGHSFDTGDSAATAKSCGCG